MINAYLGCHWHLHPFEPRTFTVPASQNTLVRFTSLYLEITFLRQCGSRLSCRQLIMSSTVWLQRRLWLGWGRVLLELNLRHIWEEEIIRFIDQPAPTYRAALLGVRVPRILGNWCTSEQPSKGAWRLGQTRTMCFT